MNAVPQGQPPVPEEVPFYCALEDDNLVTAVSVRTEQLLEPNIDAALVDVTISFRTRVTRQTWGNDILA